MRSKRRVLLLTLLGALVANVGAIAAVDLTTTTDAEVAASLPEFPGAEEEPPPPGAAGWTAYPAIDDALVRTYRLNRATEQHEVTAFYKARLGRGWRSPRDCAGWVRGDALFLPWTRWPDPRLHVLVDADGAAKCQQFTGLVASWR